MTRDRREVMRRLGAPYRRCERCRTWSLEKLSAQADWSVEPIRMLQVCGLCWHALAAANRSHVQREVDNEMGLEQAKYDLESQFDRPSDSEYLAACQRMREGEW